MPVDSQGLTCPLCGLAYGDPDCPHPPPRRSGGIQTTPAAGTLVPSPVQSDTGVGLKPDPDLAPPPPPPPPLAPRGGVVPRPPASAAPPPPADRSKDLFVGADVVPIGDCKITSLGYERCGKTTY